MTEMNRLIADMTQAATRTVAEVDPIIKKGAVNLKDDLNKQASNSRHFRGMAGSVTFDSRYGFGLIGYEVGPDKARRGGALGNIFFFGGASGGGGPCGLGAAPAREEPTRVEAVGAPLGAVL